MPYNISRADGTPYTVADGAIDTTYQSPLIGRDAQNYGAARAQDTLQTLENYANSLPPTSAIPGQLWFKKDNEALYIFVGTDNVDVANLDNWKAVRPGDGDPIYYDLIPDVTGTLDIGTITKRFHNLYATHGNFSVALDPNADADPALSVTGEFVLENSSLTWPRVNAAAGIGSDLGKTTHRWRNIYTKDINVNNTLTFNGASSVSFYSDLVLPDTIVSSAATGTVNIGSAGYRYNIFAKNATIDKLNLASDGLISSIIPDATTSYNIGSNSRRINDLYAQEIYEGGVSLSVKYGGGAIALDDLNDVVIVTPINGDVLTYDAGEWKNIAPVAGGGDHGALSGLTDDDHLQYFNQARGDATYLKLNGGTMTGDIRLPSLTAPPYIGIVAPDAGNGGADYNMMFSATIPGRTDSWFCGGLGGTAHLCGQEVHLVVPYTGGGFGVISALSCQTDGDSTFLGDVQISALPAVGRTGAFTCDGNITSNGKISCSGDISTSAGSVYVNSPDSTTPRGVFVQQPLANFGAAMITQIGGLNGFQVWQTDGIGAFQKLIIDHDIDAGIGLYYNNVAKIETISNGIQVYGDVEYTGALTFISDERLKDNVTPIYSALKSLKSIPGVRYNYSKEAQKEYNLSADQQLGVLAQDVEKVYPELVVDAAFDSKYKMVKTDKLIPVLLEALREADDKIDKLESDVAELKAAVAQLMRK